MENNICVSFYLRRSTIHLHRSTLNGINTPQFVRFLISQDRKSFLVRSWKAKDFHSFRVLTDQAGRVCNAEIHSYGLCEFVTQINGWDANFSYRVYGKVFPNQEIALFDFASAVVIHESESIMECETLYPK